MALTPGPASRYGLTISLTVNAGARSFMRILGMNHAVLYVRDAQVTAAFYERILDFSRVIDDARFVFMRANASPNHHDIAFFTVGAQAADSAAGHHSVGLYHIAWEVPTLDDLVAWRRRLAEAGALVGESDHGANKSLYAKDPDGLEFEVMWLVPAERWGDEEHQAIIRPLLLDDEVARDRRLSGRAG
jgi:catechol-2,3-dioxygenase